MDTKFNIGDEVSIVSNGSVGIIKDVTSYVNNGDIVYLVDVGGKQKAYTGSNLRIVRKFNRALNVDISEMSANFQYEDKVNEILEKLQFVTPTNEETQLLNAAKLHMYLASDPSYDESTKKSIEFYIRKLEMFNDLLESRRDSIVNAYIFSELLNKAGNKVLNVVLRDENDEKYVANLVLIGDEYYYFDVTLEHSVFIENGGELQNFVLCCGALGKSSYEQFFKPVSIIDFHSKTIDNRLPDNVARLDIDIDLVNKLISI